MTGGIEWGRMRQCRGGRRWDALKNMRWDATKGWEETGWTRKQEDEITTRLDGVYTRSKFRDGDVKGWENLGIRHAVNGLEDRIGPT